MEVTPDHSQLCRDDPVTLHVGTDVPWLCENEHVLQGFWVRGDLSIQ